MTSSRVVRALALGLLLLALGRWLGARAETLPPGQPAGHQRMLERLRQIAERTADENPWLGEREARAAREDLARLEDPLEHSIEGAGELLRLRALLRVGEHELRLGDESQAILRFEEARALLERLGPAIDPKEAARALFRVGVAHLRYGEVSNCAGRPSAESCILPIRGAGVHHDPSGSREAIRLFEEVLGRVPQSSPLFIKTVWLLNIAHMTLGGYPDQVPERYRVPPRVFAAEHDFPRFPNVAPSAGIDTFDLSGGTVADDFDGDDDVDILTTTFDTAGDPHYFRNQGDGTFLERTAEAGLTGLHGGLNAVHADYDNDGDLDVFVLRGAWLYAAGRHPDSLWRNDGSGRFTDVTFEAGLGDVELPSQAGAWGDYDNDGDVDLFVGNEHGANPDQFGKVAAEFEAPSQLFRNNGDGTFTDVARAAGLGVRAFVKGAVWGDYDNDRDLDLYVSVLGGQNLLFRNHGEGSFTDVATQAGVAQAISSFAVWFWDYDNDGNLDLYVTTFAGAPDSVALVAASYFGLEVPYDKAHLYRGDGHGGFVDVAAVAGLHRIHLTMGANFGDVDNDGYLDFYLGTGYPDYEGLMPNVLYQNVAGQNIAGQNIAERRFADVTMAAGVGHLQKGHAVAFADVDGDGDLDLFEQMGGAYPGDRFSSALYRNPGFGHRYVVLQLVGTRSNRAAIGTRIHAVVVENGIRRSLYRHVNSGGSFGANPLRQTLGLGAATALERLEVYWPTTDLTQVFHHVPMDRCYRVFEGRDELVEFRQPTGPVG